MQVYAQYNNGSRHTTGKQHGILKILITVVWNSQHNYPILINTEWRRILARFAETRWTHSMFYLGIISTKIPTRNLEGRRAPRVWCWDPRLRHSSKLQFWHDLYKGQHKMHCVIRSLGNKNGGLVLLQSISSKAVYIRLWKYLDMISKRLSVEHKAKLSQLET